MKTKQPRIITLMFGKPPIQTSYMVTDYHHGYNTGKYYYEKHRVELLPDIKAFYTVSAEVCGNEGLCSTTNSKESMVYALRYMHSFCNENPRFLPLRIYY